MKNFQIIKESIAMSSGLKASEKILNILETYEHETAGMTKEEKLKYLEGRV